MTDGRIKRQFIKNCCVFSFINVVFIQILFFSSILAHVIHIDHNEFHTKDFPKPHLPPPLAVFEDLQQHSHSKQLSPSELMVDLTNDLTYRILHYHSILNRNNFAFSPTALMSVLVALYEGSAGRSVVEIRNVLQLPNQRDIIRVGYRDIHRRLRTYFFGSDNPLKGLSLNKENVTITKEYETVLMFYGYDLGIDMVASHVTPSTITASTLNEENEIVTTTISSTSPQSEEPATMEQTKTNVESTTEQITTTLTPIAPSTEQATTKMLEITSETSVTEKPTTEPSIEITTTEEETTEATTQGDTEAAELVAAFVAEADAEPLLRIEKARVTRLPIGKLQVPPQAKNKLKTNYLPSLRNTSTINRMVRPKRHIFDYNDLHSNPFITLFRSPPLPHSLYPLTGHTSELNFAHLANEFHLNLETQFLSKANLKQNYNTDVISHVFYLTNQQTVYTTFKVYNAVLYYKYLENMKMSVLELELDTPEYNLMILLPDFHTDLVSAAASLRVGPTLRSMRKQLKPRWVQAIIPDFKLHGTMFLTNDLQNMGVIDIFEPNRADFRPMTKEKGVYVKHIEQSINVNIRTHPINQLKRSYGSQTQPIQISVNHPFLFFIIDRDLDVAVMTGRILNPLNVRIQ